MIILKKWPIIKFTNIEDYNDFVQKINTLGYSVFMYSGYDINVAFHNDYFVRIHSIDDFSNTIRLTIEHVSRFDRERIKTSYLYNRCEVYISYENLLNSGKYFSKTSLLDCETDEISYAKKSSLYNKIMMDGNVFNPYIHRRFLPHQYINMYERYGGFNIRNIIGHEYSCNYALKYLEKEIKTLSMLLKYDKKTFRERSRFFTYDVIYNTLSSCANKILSKIDGRNSFYQSSVGWLDKRKIEELIYDIKLLLNKTMQANNYMKLYEIISNNKVFNIMKKFNYTDRVNSMLNKWTYAFIASGAYYTMKHLIMFEGYLFRPDQTQLEAMKELESTINNTVDADALHHRFDLLMKNNFRIVI